MKLKLTCQELTQTLSHDETQWSLGDRLRMKFHLLICDHCARYAKALRALKLGVRSYFTKTAPTLDESQKLEQQILAEAKKDFSS